MRPPVQRAPLHLHAARMIALTAAAWLQGVAFAQPYWDPFASPEFGETRDARGPRPDVEPAMPAPVDAATIGRLLGEAEAAYAAGRWAQAMEAFKAVTAFDSGNAQAWLRIGNLFHRRGQLLAAAGAYRKATSAPSDDAHRSTAAVPAATRSSQRTTSAAPSATAASVELRTKALLNLASVNLELALAALDEVDTVMAGIDAAPAPLRDARSDARAEASAIASRIDAVQAEGVVRPAHQRGAPSGNRVASQGVRRDAAPTASPSARGSPSAPPSTAAPASASAPPSPMVHVPGGPSMPHSLRPTIEYLRGAPRP